MLSLNRSKILRNFASVYANGKSFANRSLILYVLRDTPLCGQADFVADKNNRVERRIQGVL